MSDIAPQNIHESDQGPKTWLRRTVLALVAFAGAYFFLEFLASDSVAQTPKAITTLEECDPQVSMAEGFTPVVHQSACYDSKSDWAFLQEDEDAEPAQIIAPEEPLPPFDADTASVQDISKKITTMVAKEAQVSAPDFSALEEGALLDQLYEEKLPDNIIEDDTFIHHNRKNIKDLKIHLQKKPVYFGPKPLVVVVIDDMGISPRRTKDILKLKAPLTASFLTYGKNLPIYLKQAELAGQEIMVHVPMEPKTNIDVAPDVLKASMSSEEIHVGLKNMLQKFDKVAGINNHMGSRFTENRKAMQSVMDVLKEENLFFLDSKTSAKSVGKELAHKNGVAYAHRHVFLDNKNDFDYILGQLHLTERIAKRNGYAIAIGHPKSQTFNALKAWLPTLEEKNIKLVPLSEVVTKLNASH